MRAEENARQGLLRFVVTLGGAIAAEMTTQELCELLDDQLKPLQLRREAFERAAAEEWLEVQARTLKPRKPRNTAAKRRRELLAELAAADRRQEAGA